MSASAWLDLERKRRRVELMKRRCLELEESIKPKRLDLCEVKRMVRDED